MAADFAKVIKAIESAVEKFNSGIPALQKGMYEEIASELGRLERNGDSIKQTVANIRILASIKNKLIRLILTDKYVENLKEFIGAFDDVTKLQNAYWKSVETSFKPKALLGELKTQAIGDTVKHLTESGIGTNIANNLSEILNSNITTGGSYKSLQNQLLESLTDTQKSSGLVTRYAKQITTDSLNQFSAQYTQAVSSDLGFEWYAYQGSDIVTTRPFCDAMTDFRYFHISEVPRLLKAEDLYYMKDGERTKVPIYPKTGLPHGLMEGTNVTNFFVRRGGYNCGHQIRPVSERLVPIEIKDRVFNTPAYQRWKGNQ